MSFPLQDQDAHHTSGFSACLASPKDSIFPHSLSIIAHTNIAFENCRALGLKWVLINISDIVTLSSLPYYRNVGTVGVGG